MQLTFKATILALSLKVLFSVVKCEIKDQWNVELVRTTWSLEVSLPWFCDIGWTQRRCELLVAGVRSGCPLPLHHGSRLEPLIMVESINSGTMGWRCSVVYVYDS
jgi:hypothetical protein